MNEDDVPPPLPSAFPASPVPESLSQWAPPPPVAAPAVMTGAGSEPLPQGGGYAHVEQPVSAIQRSAEIMKQIRRSVEQVFVGQAEVIYQVQAALLAGGHVLLEGKPGLGKTHLVLALARTFGAQFSRIQFTPDLMPSDVTGHTLYDMGSQTFRVRQGPVFTQLLLADEINRAPAKTQSALLEVMQEAQVTIDGEAYPLTPPFITFATQNPIEQEGTYPLPEAQLDRFLLKVQIDYPAAQQEAWIVKAVASGAGGSGLRPEMLQQVCDLEAILQAQRETAAVEAADSVVNYAVNLVRATRSHGAIALGAGTRGAISLVRVAKAYALLEGRSYITPGDVKRATLPVLRHRVYLTPEVSISGQTVDQVLESVIRSVEAPRV